MARSTMNIDGILRLLAPVTPIVLPVIVLVWYLARQEFRILHRELRGIRQELSELRERSLLPDPHSEHVKHLAPAVNGIGAQVERIERTHPVTG